MQRLLIICVGALALWQSPQARTQRFRSDSVIVPVDVRVLDQSGHAVTDLAQEDFTIEENGVPQVIAAFRKDVHSNDALRWFVIVLGNGRLQMPFKSIDALQRFVRDSLGPNDRIGVVAYNRWFAFSQDHTEILSLLDRYKAVGERIQTSLDTDRLVSVRTGKGLGIDPRVQADIDFIFRTKPDLPIHEFAPPSQLGRMSPAFATATRFTQGRFIDGLHVYGAIDYLRSLDGEKHVVLLVEQPYPFGPERPSRLAQTAADCRVSLHIVQTGGLGPRMTAASAGSASGGIVSPPTTAGPSASAQARDAADETGGLAFVYTDPKVAFQKLAAALNSEYLLGYVPNDKLGRGEYRHIAVHVRRPQVTLFYRHGYRTVLGDVVWDDRGAITDMRMAEARLRADLAGILLKISARKDKDHPADILDVELSIEPSQIAFTTVAGIYTADIDVAFWVTNRDGVSVGSQFERVNVHFDEAHYRDLIKADIVVSRRLALQGSAFEVRAAVYDYDNDRIGSIVTRRIG